MSANRTSRHGDQYRPVTDFSGAVPSAHSENPREQRYTRLKKRSILLLLIAICSAVAYVLLVLVMHLAVPNEAATGIKVVGLVAIFVAFVMAVVSGFAALIVRLVAALKR